MTRFLFFLVCGLSGFVCSSVANAEQLRSVDDFLSGAFAVTNEIESKSATAEANGATTVAKKQTLWLNKELKAQIANQLNYSLNQLRLRYWGKDNRTAWILEEIGKEQPITMGIVIDSGKIAWVDILAYRESRGYEVKYEFFKRQFAGAKLDEKKRKPDLDRGIDGITGATLSVRAVKKVATLALFLHELTPYGGDGKDERNEGV